ncbi:MAG: hypothetical protein SVO01_08895 [Thermotogota bacterium]|nr:hypothetical protein [Thermotogota bacterium]
MKAKGVQEYCEEMPVKITKTKGLHPSKKGKGRLVVKAFNEGGFNSTEVDLLQLIEWVRKNMPDVISESKIGQT